MKSTTVISDDGSVTRGYGFLEKFLAGRRARMANALIPPHTRQGQILDIGCGTSPYFLAHTEFVRKIGVDKVISPDHKHEDQTLSLVHFDIDNHDTLPFENECCDVVTMLAVFEHINPQRLIVLLNEVERVLRPGGLYVMTTPAGWTGPILDVLKWLRLVSAVEIDEHEDSYSRAKIRAILNQTRLAGKPTRWGSFECFMNHWVVVTK